MVKDVTFGQIISESFENIASDSTKKSKLCDGDKAERVMSQMDLSGFGKKFDTSSLFGALANRAEECGANWDITRLHYTHCALLDVSTFGTCD